MKKLIALFTVFSIMAFGMTSMSWAAKTTKGAKEETKVEEQVNEAPETEAVATPEVKQVENPSIEDNSTAAGTSLHSTLKTKFAEGGPLWMTCVLISLLLGIAFSIERIFYLNLSNVNASKLLAKLDVGDRYPGRGRLPGGSVLPAQLPLSGTAAAPEDGKTGVRNYDYGRCGYPPSL